MNSIDGMIPALDVNTDYVGEYPTAETFRQHAEIERLCGKRFRAEQRGFYTAVYITEA